MTHDELLNTLNSKQFMESRTPETPYFALRAVVELHKPFQDSSGWWHCNECDHIGDFGCPTIQAIEKELS